MRVGAADCAVDVHRHETVGVARTRGTDPPTSGGTRSVVLVLNFAVPGSVIRILRLFAGFVAVCVSGGPEYFVFR